MTLLQDIIETVFWSAVARHYLRTHDPSARRALKQCQQEYGWPVRLLP